MDLDDRATRTLQEMMLDRGMPEGEVLARNLMLYRVPGKSVAIVVIDAKTKESEIIEMLEAVENPEAAHSIIIVTKDLRRKCEKIVRESGEASTVFTEQELLYNRGRHPDVQKYEVLSPPESAAVCNAYGISPEALPLMHVHDQQARYRGFRVGDVVKITRATENGIMTHYRRVVS